ncbi:uncharacterized protein LOC143211438 [Lasioglossum baleicum]|uniref:uncharacterized protein LOC143211438 n=1 Tax=Lasioglossum baleicum TaxID=434251 RepID=UPI003FCC3054
MPEDRMTRLLKWKEKRRIQKQIEKMKSKDPFVVRAVDKNIFSLPENSTVQNKPIKATTEICKKITKATEKRIMRKVQLQKVDRPSAKSRQPAPEKECDNQNWKPSEQLDQEPLFGRVHLAFGQLFERDMNSSNVETHNNDNSLKSEHVDIDNEPIFFSPYVVSSRGKSNARNEQRMKRGLSLNHSLGDDIPTKDTVMKNLNISIEEEERTAQYFQFLLGKEVDRLNKLCDKWTAVKEELDTTEDGQYQINQAVGQTNLLMSKKFERFRRLVADCETGKGEMLVTCKDLQGFWDMMYMEIKNCDSRFDKLEQLKSQGWKEEEVYDAKKLPAKKRATVKTKVVPKKASEVITFMREKRKKIKEDAASSNDKKLEILNIEGKTRRSIGPVNHKPSPINKHNRRSSLLQKVQISAAKKLRSPLTIMKVSQMCKTPEVRLDSTISYINSDQTPGKSILKQPKKSNEIESCTKSSHKVNFNDTIISNEVPMDEETQTKMELAAALARIDSLEFDDCIEDVPVHAEKRLIFDDSSSDECDNVFNTSTHSEKMESISDTINVTPVEIQGATSLEPSTLCDNSISPLPSRRLRRQTALDISDVMLNIVSPPSSNGIVNDVNVTQSLDSEEETHGYNKSVRVLRNRSITSSNIPTPRRRTKQMSANKQETEYKENINSKDDLSNDISTSSNGKRKTKKSEKSITFSEVVCNTHREKTAFPITPHVRSSKTQSSDKKRRTTSANSELTTSSVAQRVRRTPTRKSSTAF